MNQRRLDNFRRNKRGAWSLRIFLVLFVASLFGEFIANDRPLIASYKGEILFPVLFDYPEDKFGGFEARADFRGAFVANEVNANGWMIWPPIRFANSTTILNPPTPLPTPPTWMLSEAQCRAALEKQNDKDAAAIAAAMQPARAAVARLGSGRARHRRAPHLRLPHFDSVRTDAGRRLVGDRRVRRRGAGLFRRLARSHDAAGDRDLVVAAAPLYPHHPVGDPRAELLCPVDDPAPVLLGKPRPSGQGRIPQGAQLRICQRRARARPLERQDHRQACAAERDGGDADLPAFHRQFLDQHADLARLPRPRHAARLAFARRASASGQVEPVGAVDRTLRLRRDRADAVAPHLHRRSGARRLRPRKTFS